MRAWTKTNASASLAPLARVVLGAVGVAAAAATALAQPVPMYDIQDLGSLAGNAGSSAGLGLNDRGEVVGWSTAPALTAAAAGVRPFVWGSLTGTGTPTMRDLLPGVAGAGSAADRNEFGLSIGTLRGSNAMGERGFVVGAPTGVATPVTFIQPLPGGHATAANAVNDSNRVVGSSTLAATAVASISTHAIAWQNGQTVDLGTLGGRNSEARAINNPGTIVGVSDAPSSALTGRPMRRGFLIPGGTTQMQPLSALSPIGNSWANDISDLNLTCGGADAPVAFSSVANRPTRAVVWTPNTTSIINLGTLRNTDRSSEALACSDDGSVVGWSGTPSNATVGPNPTAAGFGARAFIWREGVMTDLNTRIPAGSGWILHVAADINEDGQIVGWGTRLSTTAASPGRVRAFLLTPMPLDAADESK